MLRRGDLLVEKSGGGERQAVGAVVLFDHDVPAVSSNFVARLRPAPGFAPEYLTYLHRVLYSRGLNIPWIKQTTGIQNLDVGGFLTQTIPVPSSEEQTAIVSYLNYVDSRIQRLIAAKERLIELLEEEKQAIIHRAVTRGLDPDVPLKPSGVDWLGDVPAHWSIRRVKTLTHMKAGDSITVDSIEASGPYPVYGGNGLRGYTDRASHRGARLLVGRQGALCGNVHTVDGEYWASEHAIVVEPQGDCDLGWLHALLTAMDLNQYSQAAAQPGLSTDRIRNLMVPVPPAAEQRLIREEIEGALNAIDAGVNRNARRHIELLREYRTRLISDVVTGKLDVRERARRLSADPEHDAPELDEQLEEAVA